MIKKYINYKRKDVYAIYYVDKNTLYYNLNFLGMAQLFLIL